MTLQEIQYKAQAIMQKWRDEDSAPYVEFVEVLASMEVLEIPEGLEEAAEKHIEDIWGGVGHPGWDWGTRDVFDAFIAGAEWQRKQDQSLIELAEDHAMLAGMNKMKEEMMEKAIEIEVKEDAGGFPIVPLDAIELYDYENDKPLAKAGDKVRVIVIKED